MSQEGKCHYQTKCADGHDFGFTDLPEGDEDKLKEAVATIGPISIAIDASHESFQLYKSGTCTEYLWDWEGGDGGGGVELSGCLYMLG